MNKKIKIVLCMMLVVICGFVTYDFVKPDNKELPVNYIHGDYVIDMQNPKEVIGLGDYVFVAQVNEELETEYRNVKEVGSKKIATPYTIYSITVIDNLKGNIKKKYTD